MSLIWVCPICGKQEPGKTEKLTAMALKFHLERKHGKVA
jgi:hypothetical protein